MEVWHSVDITGEGVSIVTFSKDETLVPEAITEDETWFTWSELLQHMVEQQGGMELLEKWAESRDDVTFERH